MPHHHAGLVRAVDRVHAKGHSANWHARSALRGPPTPGGDSRAICRTGRSRAKNREQPIRRACGAASVPTGRAKGTGLGKGGPILGCLQYHATARDRCCVLRDRRHSAPAVGRRDRHQRLGVQYTASQHCVAPQPNRVRLRAMQCAPSATSPLKSLKNPTPSKLWIEGSSPSGRASSTTCQNESA